MKSKDISCFFLFRIIIYLTITSTSTHADDLERNNNSFIFYNELQFKNQPDLNKYGLKDIRVMYSGELWRSKRAEPKPDISFLNQLVPEKLSGLNMICLDIEHWQLDSRLISKQKLTDNIQNYTEVLDIFKTHLPTIKIGYYGMLPIRDYHSPVKNKNIHEWENANKKLMPIANKTDFIFPSLYTFYKDPINWKKYAIANINEAKKYGKPVIAFLWPQYHGSNRFRRFDFIDAEFWYLQLQTVFEHADGAIIWSPRGKERSEWNPEAEWWKATKLFIKNNNLSTMDID